MPAPPLANTFEGGTNGTTITTANSGGASGDAFSAGTIGAAGTLKFDNTHSRDSLAVKIANASSQVSQVEWRSLGGLTGNVYFRAYIYITALPNAHWYFARCQSSTNAKCVAPEITTAGKLTFENAAGTDNASTTANVLPT